MSTLDSALPAIATGLSNPIAEAAGVTSQMQPLAAPPTAPPLGAPTPVDALPVGGGEQIDSFMNAIRTQESGGNYQILGPQTRYGRPRGAYQILDGNWDSWAAEAGLPGADWRDPAAQDRVARYKFLQYYQQFGSWEAVAVAWFAGPGRAADYVQNPSSVANLSDVLGTSVARYVQTAMNGMGTPTNPVQSAYATPDGQNGRLDPADLVAIDGAGHLMAPEAGAAWGAMVQAAAAEGVAITAGNSYRDYDTQVRLAQEKGLYSQGGLAAEPGHSNHGLGTAVDIEQTPEAVAWLRANGGRFGFDTIPREPWHWEYKGGYAGAPATTQPAGAPGAPASRRGAEALLSVFSRLMSQQEGLG